MSNNLLTPIPKTRINDCFIEPGSKLNFTPVRSPFKDPLIQGLPNSDHRFQADFYRKIGIDIVVETALNYPYPFITEKTYRPIASNRPFIILGPYKTLEFIRSLGFHTFPTIIDESYDTVYNPEERFIKVCMAIKKFVDRPIDIIKQDVMTVKDSLVHNQNCLARLASEQLQKFIEQIQID